jgi:hypothetical protein
MARAEERHDDGKDLADEIRRYLASHPQQMDSLTGIVSWWWEFERYRVTTDAVEQALEQLLLARAIDSKTVGGNTLYFLRRTEETDGSPR